MARITPSEALERISADGLLNSDGNSARTARRKAKGRNPLAYLRAIGDADESIYVFRRGSNAILAPADDLLKPILAECESATFEDKLPPALQVWLAEYAHEIEWWQGLLGVRGERLEVRDMICEDGGDFLGVRGERLEVRDMICEDGVANEGGSDGGGTATAYGRNSDGRTGVSDDGASDGGGIATAYQTDDDGGAKARKMVAAAGRVSVVPLLSSKWAQTSPYNNHLVFDGKKCMVGCNATAAAQIMRYWAQKGLRRGCTAVPGYVTEDNQYQVAGLSPVTVFDFSRMTDGKPSRTDSIEAVATLMEYVGKAFQNDYRPASTSAYPKVCMAALQKMLRMGSGIRMIYAAKGAAKFEQQIYEEITHGRPVMLSGYNANGGHCFVCDGYDEARDLYHFNFGWGGSYNGYYAMSAINPFGDNTYNGSKNAIVGIMPDYPLGDANLDGEVDVSDIMAVAGIVVNGGGYRESADLNGDGEVTVTDYEIEVDLVRGKLQL